MFKFPTQREYPRNHNDIGSLSPMQPQENELSKNIFTATRGDIVAPSITSSTESNVSNSLEHMKNVLGSARSEKEPFLQITSTEEPPTSSKNFVDFITKKISEALLTEEPLSSMDNTNVTSSTISVFENVNTNSSSTVESVFTTTIPKKGFFEGENKETTMKTLRDVFVKAVSRESPLYKTTGSEKPLIDISNANDVYSTKKNPLFDNISWGTNNTSFEVTDQNFLEDLSSRVTENTLFEGPNGSWKTMKSIIGETLFTEKTSLNKMTQPPLFKDESAVLSNQTLTEISANNTLQNITEIFRESVETEAPMLDFNSSEEFSTEAGISTMENHYQVIKNIVSPEIPSFEASTEFTLNTNSARNILTDVLNESVSTETTFSASKTFDTLKGLNRTGPTESYTASDVIKDIFNGIHKETTENTSSTIERDFYSEGDMSTESSTVDMITDVIFKASKENLRNETIKDVTDSLRNMSTEYPLLQTDSSSTSRANLTSHIFETIISSEKPSDTEVYTTTDSMKDIFMRISNATLEETSEQFDITNKTGIFPSELPSEYPLYKFNNDTNTPTAGGFEDMMSTVSNNIISITTEDSLIGEQNKRDVDENFIVYVIVGISLGVLIMISLGIYIYFRKFKKNSKSTGYYVTDLKDYSDSSMKIGPANMRV
ncbi:hypothetical protein JTB14_022676 [Gonioctena quinquepunctata]|nr:hypothetical protein JTB14_022676 [Gonioctena quinquepunctata]